MTDNYDIDDSTPAKAQRVAEKPVRDVKERPSAYPPGAFGLSSPFPGKQLPPVVLTEASEANMLEAARLRRGKKPSERLQKLFSTEQLRALGYDI